MKTSIKLIDAHTSAAKQFQRAEVALSGALNELEAHRAQGGDVTAQFRYAQQAERDADETWSRLETARRAYWEHRAKVAEAELERQALPLVALIQHCRQAARSGMVGVSPPNPGPAFLASLALKPLPPVPTDDLVPVAGAESAALDRAEEDLYTRGRSLPRGVTHFSWTGGA